LSSGRTAATVANVAIPAGAVLAAGGVTLLVLATMSDRPADAHAPPPASLRARPLLGPGLAAVNLEGTF
jgi:hypothetical protein